MYSLEDRMKAVSLYFKYGGSSATVRRELGYPSRKSLRLWVREYKATGVLHEGYSGARKPKYSNEQKQVAVDYYLEHGRSLRGTIRELGYPHRETLKQWLDEALPDRRGLHSKRRPQAKVELTLEQKREAVVDLGSRDGPAREVAERYGVTRAALYKWNNELLGKESPLKERKRKDPKHSDDRDVLVAKVESLKEQVQTLAVTEGKPVIRSRTE